MSLECESPVTTFYVSQDHLPSHGHQSASSLSQVVKRAGYDDIDDDAIQVSIPTSNSIADEFLQLTEPMLEKEKLEEEPLPEFELYKQEFYTSSPVNQLDESTSDAVKVQLSAENNFEQIDELGSNSLLDGSQEHKVVPERIIAASLGDELHGQQQEMDTLKEKLKVSLSTLKDVEQELLDNRLHHEQQMESLNASHAAELEKLHEQHRMVVEKLATEASAQPPVEADITKSRELDRDEIEMERLKLIKESLKENYEREKNELRENLVKEHQEKMELFKEQMEKHANTQLQEYHKQYVAAYEEQAKQKAEAQAALLQTLDTKELEYQEKLSQLQQCINNLEDKLQQANEEKQLEVAKLSKSHSDQLQSMQLGKQELEIHLKEQIEQWKSKAASLEQHLLNSTSNHVLPVDTESIEQLKTNYEEKLSIAIYEKAQVESQLLSQINALNEELSSEKQQQELSIEEKNSEIQQLLAELERVNQSIQSKETTVTNISNEIEEMQHQHKEALEKLQLSLTQAHEVKLAATQKELKTVNNHLQGLSKQITALKESKQDAFSQLEKTQHQLNNVQLSFAQCNEEKQQLIKKYQNQISNLEVDLNAAQISSAQTKVDFERDTNSHKTQISQLETAINEFQSRELLLQTELKALREQKVSENVAATSAIDVLFTELDTEILRKAENLTSSGFTSSLELINKLLATLESRASEVMLLQESNKKLVSQISELQVNISDDKPCTTEVDLLHSYEQLQVAYEELKDSSNIEIENLKHEKRVLQDIHQDQLREREKTISTLQKQLQTTDLVSAELQKEFGRECVRYESEKQSLEQAVKETAVTKDAFDNIVSAQAKEIEQEFEKERQALVAKINEKEALEAELTTRKIELERRLTEKTKLEEVLAEKSRLEQELRSQKAELEHELFEIEAKLKSRESEIKQERNDWSLKLSQKDSTIQLAQEKLKQQDELFLQKERQLKESHDQEVYKLLTDIEHSSLKTKEIVDNLKTVHTKEMATLKSDMDEKNSQALNELEVKLNKSHQEELGELKEKHSIEVI